MDKELAIRVLKEAAKRAPTSVDLLSAAFPQQKKFLEDTSRLKAAKCPRRSSKSYTAGLGLFDRALKRPGVKCFYVTKTMEMARNIMWRDILKVIDSKFRLGCEFNESRLEITLPNQSTIRLMGIDTDAKQQDKLLGGKYALVVLDEIAFFKTDLDEIIYKTLIPATADLLGEVWMMSTTSNLTSGLFYEVTRNGEGSHKGWSVHEWSWKDNPYTRSQVQETIDKLIEANPLIVDTPFFKQMYENKWIVDVEAVVYKFDPSRNLADRLPPAKYSYVLGVDLGWNDANAFVVCAYSPHDKNLYVVETVKKSKMILDKVAIQIKQLQEKYDVYVTVIDNANKQAVETMKARYDLFLTPAEKIAKADHIDIMNSDMIMGKIKVLPACKDLVGEWKQLIWDPTLKLRGERKEHSSLDNHLSDACLYAWRHCYNYLAIPEDKIVTQDDEEYMDQFFEEEGRRMNSEDQTWWEEI